MRTSVQEIHQLVAEITPLDELESSHRTQALRWLEFSEARWWTPDQIQAADSSSFDPHFPRFVTKQLAQ
jgi:hypothetical protein